jgi:hypothetical protein
VDGRSHDLPPPIPTHTPTYTPTPSPTPPTETPTTPPVCAGTVVSFTSVPNGGSVDLSSYFAAGSVGSGDECCSGENRVYDLRGYNSGFGYNYIIGGTVTNDGTLVWQPNGNAETATLTDTFQFISNWFYSEYMTLTIRCESDPITPPIPPPPP